jgi:hypothetical protein
VAAAAAAVAAAGVARTAGGSTAAAAAAALVKAAAETAAAAAAGAAAAAVSIVLSRCCLQHRAGGVTQDHVIHLANVPQNANAPVVRPPDHGDDEVTSLQLLMQPHKSVFVPLGHRLPARHDGKS